jgi:choice-of-anchor C domain-containing protein
VCKLHNWRYILLPAVLFYRLHKFAATRLGRWLQPQIKIVKGNTMISFRALRTPLVAIALASMAVGSHAAGNLLINGDFELNLGDVASGGYTVVNAGSTMITGWTVGEQSVDLIRDAYGSITSVSIDLDGTPGPGSLSQSFNQVLGQTYTLVWDYFRNPPGSNLGVKFGDLGPVTYTNVSTLTSYVTESLTYVAASTGLTSVTFTSSGGSGGPTIDNVSVTAVPEPEGIVLAIAGLGLLGAFRARRNRA